METSATIAAYSVKPCPVSCVQNEPTIPADPFRPCECSISTVVHNQPQLQAKSSPEPHSPCSPKQGLIASDGWCCAAPQARSDGDSGVPQVPPLLTNALRLRVDAVVSILEVVDYYRE
jgi:hypothetical protein